MDREEIFKKIENERGSRLITYITGDRKPFTTQIGDDVVPIINRHLENIGIQKKISLFLFTRGGDMLAPLRIVKLIKSHTSKFEVIIPLFAQSAGTMIAIGANTIIMGKLGELSPVDPKTGHPFNPRNPDNPKQVLEVSVEDLNSYFMLAKEMAGVKEEQKLDVFKMLVDKIHPLSLGNIYRAFRMSKILTERLLCLHMDRDKDKDKIKKITNALTGDICIHGYPITRDEALDLGLNIEKSGIELEKLIYELYNSYAEIMKLGIPFNPTELLSPGKESEDISYSGAYIESIGLSDQFIFKGKVIKSIRDNKSTIDININSQKWEKVK